MSTAARRPWPGLEWLVLLVAVAQWVALKYLRGPQPPELLAVLVVVAMTAFTARLLWLVWRQWRCRRGWLAAVGEAALLAGVLVALGGGMANWLLGLQGAVILHEGESALLHGGTDLQAWSAGPLARLEEMDLVLELREVELVPEGGGVFHPKSHFVLRWHGEPAVLEVAPGQSARQGSLRFFQGAFGFAPRIVVTRGDETLFDRVVPFTTDLHAPLGVAFAGRFEIAEHDLDVEGRVDLGSLDERLRGHATLALTVRRGGAVVGRGSLLPGHFANLEDGLSVGFAGLEKWSEIDLARHAYSRVVLGGAGGALAGALLWPVGLWHNMMSLRRRTS